jgi:hypothetical protein
VIEKPQLMIHRSVMVSLCGTTFTAMVESWECVVQHSDLNRMSYDENITVAICILCHNISRNIGKCSNF